MKKIRNLVMLLIVTLLLTGCVKYNVNMDIKKDKSMEFKIVYALDTSVLGEKATFTKDDLNKMKDQGFEVEEYTDGSMKGFTLTKKIKNIDDVSSTDDIKYSLSGITNNDSTKLFKVKKGLLKNKYTAKFSFDSSESGIKNSSTFNNEENNSNDETIVDPENNSEITNTEESDDLDLTDSDEDYSKMMSSMDLSFTVTLPYKALSNNATSVNNDGKELVWNLASTNQKSIEFEFELDRFSIMPIIIVIGCVIGGLFVITLIVTVIMAISGGKKQKKSTSSTETKA